MTDQITTAAELDALPEGTIASLSIRISKGLRPVATIKSDGKWYLTGVFTADGCGHTAADLLDEAVDSLTVLHRPVSSEGHSDAAPEPQRVQPSVEAIAKRFWHLACTDNRVKGDIYPEDCDVFAEAVHALLAAQPTAREVAAKALDEYRAGLPDGTEWFATETRLVKAIGWDEGFQASEHHKEEAAMAGPDFDHMQVTYPPNPYCEEAQR
jgi:hypothetical protein